MDSVQAAQFANTTGRFFQVLATQVGDFLHQHIDELTDQQISIISNDQTRLISYSNTFFSLSDHIAFDGVDEYVPKVTNATAGVSDALKKMKTADKIISITAGVISLAAGIVSQNGGAILSSLQSIDQAIKD